MIPGSFIAERIGDDTFLALSLPKRIGDDTIPGSLSAKKDWRRHESWQFHCQKGLEMTRFPAVCLPKRIGEDTSPGSFTAKNDWR